LSLSGPYVLILYRDALLIHTCISEYWGLTSHTWIYGHEGVLSGTAGKEAFQTPEGLAASISTEPIPSFEGGFSDQITSCRVQIRLT